MNYNISKGCLAPQVGNDKDAETLNRLACAQIVVNGFGMSELSLFICHVYHFLNIRLIMNNTLTTNRGLADDFEYAMFKAGKEVLCCDGFCRIVVKTKSLLGG